MIITRFLPLLLAGLSQAPFAATPVAGNWEGEMASDQWPTFVRVEIGTGVDAKATLFVLGQTVDLGQVKNTEALDATIGDGEDALKVVGHVEGDRLVGTLSEAGKSFAFKLQRIPTYEPTSDRVVGWSRDLDAIRDRVLAFDRSFDPAEREATKAAIEQLRSELPSLSDDAVQVRIARIAAMANNAHTRLYLLRNRTEVRRMPIRAWWFGSELRVVRASPAYARFLGCRIDRVGKLPTAAARARIVPMFAGSPTWQTYMSTYSLTSPEVLHGAGIVDASGPVTYRFSDCGNAGGSASIEPLPLAKSSKPLESWWDLAPLYAGAPDDWKQVLGGQGTVVPLYLRHPDRNYWFDAGKGAQPFYIQYNRAADAADEKMSVFAKRAGETIDARKPNAVVVDLRFNTGGNGNLTKAMVDAVKRAPASSRIYVIAGRATFSAGIVAAAELRSARKVTIVGEPMGDGLNFWAEGGNIILPYSGLYVHFANGAHSLSPRPCPTSDYCDDLNVRSLEPDLAAPLSWQAYKSRRDPAMDAIARDLQRKL